MISGLRKRINVLVEEKAEYLSNKEKLNRLSYALSQVEQEVAESTSALAQLEEQCRLIVAPNGGEERQLKEEEQSILKEIGRPRLFGGAKKRELEARLQAVCCRLDEISLWNSKYQTDQALADARKKQSELMDTLIFPVPDWKSRIAAYDDSLEDLAKVLRKLSDSDISGIVHSFSPIADQLPMSVVRELCRGAEKAFLDTLPVNVQIKGLFDKNLTVHFCGREWNVIRVMRE